MSGVKDGTCRVQREVRAIRWIGVSLCGLALWMSGCQSSPTIRGQSPGFNQSAASSRRPFRKIGEPSPDEELVPGEIHERVSPLSDEEKTIAAEELRGAIDGLAVIEDRLADFRRFFTDANMDRIALWGSHPESPLPMRASLTLYRGDPLRGASPSGP